MTTTLEAEPILIPPSSADLAMIASGKTALPPWIYPPAEFEPVDKIGYVTINDPTVSTAGVVVVSFKVPPSRNGIITTYGNNYVGGGFTEGSGDIFWQYRRNQNPIKFYERVLASLGNVAQPTRHPAGFRVFENDTIDILVTNVNIVFGNQLSGGRLMGWVYPKKYDDPRKWV